MLQTGAILCHEKMVSKGIDPGYASKLIQYGWETITEALKHGGITGMMDRLDNPSKIKCFEMAAELKEIMQPLYAKHQDDIITGHFSKTMMEDWDNDDVNLLKWRAETVRPPPCHLLSPSPPTPGRSAAGRPSTRPVDKRRPAPPSAPHPPACACGRRLAARGEHAHAPSRVHRSACTHARQAETGLERGASP